MCTRLILWFAISIVDLRFQHRLTNRTKICLNVLKFARVNLPALRVRRKRSARCGEGGETPEITSEITKGAVMEEKLTEQSVARLAVFTFVMGGMTALQLYLMYAVRELVIPMSTNADSVKVIHPIFQVILFFLGFMVIGVSLFVLIAITLIMAVIALIPAFLLRGVGLRKSLIPSVTKTEYTITKCIYFGTIPAAIIPGLFIWEFKNIYFPIIITAGWLSVMLIYFLGVRRKISKAHHARQTYKC